MLAYLTAVALVSSVAGLECYVNHTYSEKCSESWIFRASGLSPFCYNRTETREDGKVHHKFGCADFAMRTHPFSSKDRDYCYHPDNNLWFGKGKVCICQTNKCNHHPHRLGKGRFDYLHRRPSSAAYLPHLVVLLLSLALL